jgi:hypothetical protein
LFSGVWHKGCFRKAGRVVAINVPRKSCGPGVSASLGGTRPADF